MGGFRGFPPRKRALPSAGRQGSLSFLGQEFDLPLAKNLCFIKCAAMSLNAQDLPHIIVGTLMEVHKELGPGLGQEAYKVCLAHELRMKEILFKKDYPVAIDYKGIKVPTAFTIDFVVESSIALHVYAVDSLEQEHKNIMKNHLQLSGLEMGFLVNFNALELRKGGLKRLIVSDQEPDLHWKDVGDPEPKDKGKRPPER